jgi:hypothetical protein
MPAGARLVNDDPVRIGDPLERIALVPLLPAARAPRRVRRLVGFFRKPSLDGGFELVELSRPSRRRSSAFSARNDSSSR